MADDTLGESIQKERARLKTKLMALSELSIDKVRVFKRAIEELELTALLLLRRVYDYSQKNYDQDNIWLSAWTEYVMRLDISGDVVKYLTNELQRNGLVSGDKPDLTDDGRLFAEKILNTFVHDVSKDWV